jgi:type 1 fimbriae regulatory protein FimB
MMYRHGLRCSQAIDLRIEDVSFDRATLWVRRLKGSNSGMHPIEGDELRAIRRYLATRNDNLPWLFLSERQGRLSRFAINYVVERTAKAAGFDNLHPHCLRHSCGYALADKGVDLRTIQEWLGHRSIEMTIRYTGFHSGDLMDCGVSSGGEWRRWSRGRGLASTRNHWDRLGRGASG